MIETAKDALRKSVDPLNLSKFGQRLATDKKYRKRTAKDALGAAATFADSALFGAPSAIKPVAKSIERLERKNPNLHTLSEIGGFLGGSALPGGAAIKALSKFKTANKLFNAGNKIKRGAAHGAVYGALQSVGKDIKTGQSFSDTAVNALGEGAVGGALFGAGISGAGKLAKMGYDKFKSGSKFAQAKEKLLGIRKNLANQLSVRDIAHAKKLAAAPEPFAGMKVNTLIHNPTEKTAAITDALYQRSPAARKVLLGAKEKFGKKHFTSIEKMLLDEYNKAAGIAKHYLKAEEAAERGLKFENVTPDDITKALVAGQLVNFL
jgi:hypothetical protein